MLVQHHCFVHRLVPQGAEGSLWHALHQGVLTTGRLRDALGLCEPHAHRGLGGLNEVTGRGCVIHSRSESDVTRAWPQGAWCRKGGCSQRVLVGPRASMSVSSVMTLVGAPQVGHGPLVRAYHHLRQPLHPLLQPSQPPLAPLQLPQQQLQRTAQQGAAGDCPGQACSSKCYCMQRACLSCSVHQAVSTTWPPCVIMGPSCVQGQYLTLTPIPTPTCVFMGLHGSSCVFMGLHGSPMCPHAAGASVPSCRRAAEGGLAEVRKAWGHTQEAVTLLSLLGLFPGSLVHEVRVLACTCGLALGAGGGNAHERHTRHWQGRAWARPPPTPCCLYLVPLYHCTSVLPVPLVPCLRWASVHSPPATSLRTGASQMARYLSWVPHLTPSSCILSLQYTLYRMR